MKSIRKQTKQCGAERAALFNTSIKRQGRPPAALNPDGNGSCAVEAGDARKHGAVQPQALQSLPQHLPWHAIKGPLEVQEANIQPLSPLALALGKVLQAEQLVDH